MAQYIYGKNVVLSRLEKGDDIENIKVKKDELMKASQAIAVKAYEKAQKNNPSDSGSNDSGTVDAEFTE